MVQVVGELKVISFLQKVVQQFSYDKQKLDAFTYTFELNECTCTIGYEKSSKLFSRNYDLVIKVEKEVERASEGSVRYSFLRNKWQAKSPNTLLQLATSKFNLEWGALDFADIVFYEKDQHRTFKMVLIPGSYTSLLFPPMKQGIELYLEEVKLLEQFLEHVTTYIDD